MLYITHLTTPNRIKHFYSKQTKCIIKFYKEKYLILYAPNLKFYDFS